MIDKIRQFIHSRQYAYRKTFEGPLADTVLADLALFCRAHESTFHPDARVSATLDGRREVWLRIANHLKLPPDELFELATGKSGQIAQSTTGVIHDA